MTSDKDAVDEFNAVVRTSRAEMRRLWSLAYQGWRYALAAATTEHARRVADGALKELGPKP